MKKFIITGKENDNVISLGKELSVQKNGNWWLVLSDTAYPNSFCYAYAASGRLTETTDPKSLEGIEPIEIPENILKYPEKYCYTAEDGFYENPLYEESGE